MKLYRDAIPISDADPFDRYGIVENHKANGALREMGTAVYLERYDMIAVGQHEPVKAMLADWRIFSSTDRPFNDDARLVPQILVTEDPPEHGRARALLMQFFTPAQMNALRPAFASEAEAIVDRALARGGEIDAVADLAQPFILSVFPDMLGLPMDGREQLLMFGEALFNGVGPRNDIFHEALVRCDPGFRWVAENTTREAVLPGGLAARTYALTQGGDVTEDEADLLVKTMLGAGFDTTIAGIVNGLKAFADFPDQWTLLHVDPSLAKAAFEESLRFDPPARMMGRMVTQDAQIAGTDFRKGDLVGLFLDAAGRDPRKWPNPDQFDIGRQGPRLGFGHGIHQCLGQALARLEGEIMYTALARRVKAIEPCGTPTRLINNNVSAWTSLPVKLHAA